MERLIADRLLEIDKQIVFLYKTLEGNDQSTLQIKDQISQLNAIIPSDGVKVYKFQCCDKD
jgi:hypothetical protein